MTKRDDLKVEVQKKIEAEVGPLTIDSIEYTVTHEVRGTVDGESVAVVVTQYPIGENPETYQGREMWRVDVLGGDGPLDRVQNPQESLALAFDSLNWNRVKASLSR
ncbi:hypothetical protein [Leucobacter chromiiresistens]|nr:hypothetical protein [Leucobacter chromiiresistens]